MALKPEDQKKLNIEIANDPAGIGYNWATMSDQEIANMVNDPRDLPETLSTDLLFKAIASDYAEWLAVKTSVIDAIKQAGSLVEIILAKDSFNPIAGSGHRTVIKDAFQPASTNIWGALQQMFLDFRRSRREIRNLPVDVTAADVAISRTQTGGDV